MIDQITKALTSIAAQGEFAAEHTCPADDLAIEVKGVGPLRFPISVATARALCAVARPAPFGLRDRTLHDKGVRDTWEIPARNVKIDARRWKESLDPALAIFREKLGLPEDGKLVAVLDKMLIYTPGQFFAPHQDSERADDMVASMVVQLPSRSSGGAVVVEHGAQKKAFRGSGRGSKDPSLLAFYADCHHEVKPITTGFRVVLTYHLLHRAAAKPRPRVTSATTQAVDGLARSVKAYFSTPAADRYEREAPERPDRLIYLLDHEYTEKSLAWTRLKNADRLRVGALRQVAERLDCETYLALADVHESWNCADEEWQGYGWRGRYGRRGYHDEDDDDAGGPDPEGADAEHELLDLCDSSVELRHWVGQDGKLTPTVPVRPDGREICFTTASVDLDPFKSKHEGYMGNYGNTVDRWYHRAALVMWPRDRNFVIRAKVSPSWAVTDLAARIKAGALAEARDHARSLLPFWARHAPREEVPFFAKLLDVALSLDDADLAHGLLSPFGPLRLGRRALPTFAALVERHGAPWSRRLFTAWAEHRSYEPPPTIPLLPDLLASLIRGAPRHGRSVAEWLLTREVDAFAEARTAELSSPELWLGSETPGQHSSGLLTLLDGARVIGATSTGDRLVALLTTGKTVLPILDVGALLKAAREGRTPSATRALGLQALHEHTVDRLERVLAAPPRSRDDWSIDLPLPCKCDLCAVLSAFLRDRSRVDHSWPLAKDRRQHIHHAIDGHRLPVTHVTVRVGSPHTLVLAKQKTLFSGEAALRARHEKLLGWLRKNRDAFAEAPGDPSATRARKAAAR